MLYIDTNLLLDFPDLGLYRGGYNPLTLVVLEAVVRELEGLGRGGGDTALQARRAGLALEGLRQRSSPRSGVALGPPQAGQHLRFEAGLPEAGTVDQLLVTAAAAAQRRQPEAAVAVVTRDSGLAGSARVAHVPVVQVHGLFDNAQLQRAVRDALAEARWTR